MSKFTHINAHGIRDTVHVDQRLGGVHLAEETVQDGLGPDNVAPAVPLDAADNVGEVLLNEEQAAANNANLLQGKEKKRCIISHQDYFLRTYL